MKKSFEIGGLILFVLLSQIFFACNDSSNTFVTPTGRVGTMVVDYITVHSLNDLVAKSTVIIQAHVSGIGPMINIAQDVNHPDQPDPNFYGGAQVYELNVDRYLKGSGSYSLSIFQPEAYISDPAIPKTADNIALARKTYPYIPMQIGSSYLFFLEPVSYPRGGYFTGAVAPWRFALDNDGNALPESSWSGVKNYFPPLSTSTLINEVEHAVKAPPQVTPQLFNN